MFIRKSKYQQIIGAYEDKIRKAEDVISQMHSKYDGIEDIETEISLRRSKFEQEELQLIRKNEEIIEKGKDLQHQYDEAYKVYSDLKQSVDLYDIRSEQIDNGIYQPIFDFKTSENFKQAITDIIDKEKELINSKQAAICSTTWTIDGSSAQGKSMINKEIKL